MTLSGDGVENSEVDKHINGIIRELDPTAITVENYEVDSGVVNQIKNCLKSSQRCTQGPSKLEILLTSILNTTRLFKALAPKILGADNNEASGNNRLIK